MRGQHNFADPFKLSLKMVFEVGNLYFNRIYIVQSLRHGDKRTGDELLNDIILRRIKNETAEIRDVATGTELYNYLDHIKNNVKLGYKALLGLYETSDFAGLRINKINNFILFIFRWDKRKNSKERIRVEP